MNVCPTIIEDSYQVLREHITPYGTLKFVNQLDDVFLTDSDIECIKNNKVLIFRNDGQQICLRKAKKNNG